jgi:hypothetical protein
MAAQLRAQPDLADELNRQKPLPARIGQRDESLPGTPVNGLAGHLGKGEGQLRGVHSEQPHTEIAVGLHGDRVPVVDLLRRTPAPAPRRPSRAPPTLKPRAVLKIAFATCARTHDSGRAPRLLPGREYLPALGVIVEGIEAPPKPNPGRRSWPRLPRLQAAAATFARVSCFTSAN